jgi:Zn-dependent peptidase ImmA (M78 family)/transcriptional regulator with XRE-family HTH domain
MPFNPDMLILARQVRGYTQGELADKTGVSQAYISRIEGRMLNAADDFVDKASKLLEMPTDLFFQNDEVRGVGSACNYHRKRESLNRVDWYRITARLNLLRIHTSRLLRGVEVAAAHRFSNIELDHNTPPERVAIMIRQFWKMPVGPVRSVIKSIEDAGGIVFKMPFGTDRIDAISQSLPGQPPLFLVNSAIPGDRLRYTLAHEIGHIIMHDKAPSDDIEREADKFAAEFLMPEHDIRHDLFGFSLQKAASTLKPFWKVSIAALMRRARDLKVITDRDYVNNCKRMSAMGYRKNEPVIIPPEEPSILKSIIDTYSNELRYSAYELAKLVHMNESEFCAEYLGSGLRLLRCG